MQVSELTVVGIPKERKANEGRVAATPALVGRLVQSGVRVHVEAGAGVRSGFTDRDYRDAGARIIHDARRLWRYSRVILKVKEPVGPELKWLHEDITLLCYLHLAAEPLVTAALLASGGVAVGLETMLDLSGHAPMLAPMSEVAGRMAALEGAWLLAKHPEAMGKYIGCVSGVAPAQVVVLGAGSAGREAIRSLIGFGAKVTVIDVSSDARQGVREEFPHISVVELAETDWQVKNCDLLIASAYRPGERAPVLVSRGLVRQMRKGSVIVDIAIDQGGCVESSRPGTHAKPVYVYKGVVHYAVPNMPGAVPRTSTQAFSSALEPHLLRLFSSDDPRLVIYQDPVWRSGINVAGHEIIHHGVQRAYLTQ
ncbi:MAG: alanine dehydrogenase [Deltaproteobacteria bacterium]|nr:alanine dehydrogenase [Deltaproteobacteria bacterium]